MCTVQDVFTDLHNRNLIDHSKLNQKQINLLSDIIKCKTPDCGFNLDVCDHCGDSRIHYCSCRNPNCPMCQAFNRERWCLKEKLNTLHVKYFHVVFTIPEELNTLVLLAPEVLYSILLDCSAETLKQMALDPQYLGAQIGFTSVLHTWGQNLSLHPHVHIIVPAGGITDSSEWKSSKKKFFLPVKALSKLFRGKFLCALKSRFPKDRLDDLSQFYQVIDTCFEKIGLFIQRNLSKIQILSLNILVDTPTESLSVMLVSFLIQMVKFPSNIKTTKIITKSKSCVLMN